MKKGPQLNNQQIKIAAYSVLSLAGVSPLVIAAIQMIDGWF